MRVFLTGGTGFVGSHIAVALHRAGHDVRPLVRRPAQLPATFEPHGLRFDDVVVADVLDAEAVRNAVQGCDAVVHAAAVFSLDARRADEMRTTNEQATRNVLGAAAEAGAQQIIHISSNVALLGRGDIDPALPLGDIQMPYCQSKIASEAVARELQAAGAPVTCVYPGGVYGPHDPYSGEQTMRLSWVARGRMPVWIEGGSHAVDVRDTADVVAAVVAGRGRAPHRYLVPGHHLTGDLLFGAVERVIGRRRRHIEAPAPLARATGRVVDSVQRHLPERWRYPADAEGIEINLRDGRFDSSPAEQDLGVTARPWDEIVRDTIAWMVDTGHLPAKYRPV
jgi:nucleoside-diphosphate-sugar epimerase